jgi:hypothetical protein
VMSSYSVACWLFKGKSTLAVWFGSPFYASASETAEMMLFVIRSVEAGHGTCVTRGMHMHCG